MTKLPQELLEQKIKELKAITATIEAMDISEEWKSRATDIAIYRGWRKINDSKEEKILNIAQINSPALATIVDQKHTKISLSKIEQIAIVVTDEADRAKIRDYLLNENWETAKQSVDLIIASYKNKESSTHISNIKRYVIEDL